MDTHQTLAEATRRYLATGISLAELWDRWVSGSTTEFGRYCQLNHLERRLMAFHRAGHDLDG